MTEEEFDTMRVIEYMAYADLTAIQDKEEFEDYVFEETQKIAIKLWDLKKERLSKERLSKEQKL